MGKRRRVPSRQEDRSIEELVGEILFCSRHSPNQAFSVRAWGPTGKTHTPVYSEKVLIDLLERGLLNPDILAYRINHMRSTEAHIPSSPSRPPKFVVYFHNLENNGLACHGFRTMEATRSFIELVLGDTKVKWVDSEEFTTDSLRIRCHRLEDILETDEQVDLPRPYPDLAARIAGRRPEAFSAPTDETPRPKATSPSGTGSTTAADIAESLGIGPSAARRILRSANVAKPYKWDTPEDIERITNILRKGKK